MGGRGNPVSRSLSEEGSEQTLAASWDRLLEGLPEDWSHLLLEVELPPDEPYHRAAVVVESLNPARCGKRTAFDFRVAHSFGYGSSPKLARNRLEQLDESGIKGKLSLLKVFAERNPLDTQGPVWRLGPHSL